VRLARVIGILHFAQAYVVLYEDVAIGTVARTSFATDAVILDDNLSMLPAIDRIHGATDHAIGILARTAGSGYQEIAKA
jgi:hypothetical protein